MTKKAEAEKRPPRNKGKGAKQGAETSTPQPGQADAPATIPPHLIRPKG